PSDRCRRCWRPDLAVGNVRIAFKEGRHGPGCIGDVQPPRRGAGSDADVAVVGIGDVIAAGRPIAAGRTLPTGQTVGVGCQDFRGALRTIDYFHRALNVELGTRCRGADADVTPALYRQFPPG